MMTVVAGHFDFTYPSGWYVNDSNINTVSFKSPDGQAGVLVSRHPFPNAASLDDVMKHLVADMESGLRHGFRFTELSNNTKY
jgi:hypothetical protein